VRGETLERSMAAILRMDLHRRFRDPCSARLPEGGPSLRRRGRPRDRRRRGGRRVLRVHGVTRQIVEDRAVGPLVAVAVRGEMLERPMAAMV